MNARLRELAARRQELAARCDRERRALAVAGGTVERKLAIVDLGFSTARRIHRHRAVLGAVAVWSVLAPASARRWIGRLGWWVPLGLEAVRLGRWVADGRGRPAPPALDAD